METADSSRTMIPKVCLVDPKRLMTSYHWIHGYIYTIATLSFCNGYFKVYFFFNKRNIVLSNNHGTSLNGGYV
jgi:hypothetical protein